jgi:uncharacterized membrane protein
MVATTHATLDTAHLPVIRKVSLTRPLHWLRKGVADLGECVPANLAHGLVMVALGWALLLMLGRHPHYVAAAVSGFLLVAPIMATGLCELSRLRAGRRPTTFDASLAVLGHAGRDLFRLGLVLAAMAAAWFIVSEAMLAQVFDVTYQNPADTYWHGFLDTASRAQWIAYVATGAVLAALVFGLSVVTVPAIIDARMSAGQAVRTSLRAVATNPAPMLLWAALITVIVAAGFLTWLLGLVVLMPLLGHATWHAYRDLVE